MKDRQHWRDGRVLSSDRGGWTRGMLLGLCAGCMLASVAMAESLDGASPRDDGHRKQQVRIADGVQTERFTEIAPGHYLHVGVHEDFSPANDGDIANTGFIVGTESVVVVDPGSSVKTALRLQRAIREVTDLPVSHVVLSHYHPDHVFGSSVFADAKTIIAHANYPRARLQRGRFYHDRFDYLLSGAPTDGLEAAPDRLVGVDSPLIIDPGDRQLVITAWPVAHTDNDLTVFDRSTGTLWAADLVFNERIPSLDGSLPGWLEVLQALAQLQPELVIPGHGSPGSWQVVADDEQRYLKLLLRQTRSAIARGVGLADAVARVGREEADRWQLFALHHPGNVSRAYTELEWE